MSEGSLVDLQVCDVLAKRPGKESGFFNVKQRVRRDLCVLSCACALRRRCHMVGLPFKALDAFASSGIQGLRLASECPALVRGAISREESVPSLEVVLCDMDAKASALCMANADEKCSRDGCSISVARRNAAALLHEQPFDVSLLDPFGSVVPCESSTFAP